MILQSDGLAGRAGEVSTMPARLLAASVAGVRSVSRLQFKAMEMPRIAASAAGALGMEGEGSDALDEERSGREARLRLAAERAAADVAAAHEEGLRLGRTELAEELEERVTSERAMVARTCDEFRSEREGYFAMVEAAVVKLALAIATRVLQREVKLDPLLLQAVVKVALGKIAEDSGMVLRVPAGDVEAWREVMESEEAQGVAVSGDLRLGSGECVLETSVGRVELGVAAQLEEIEKGFFDLLQQRPA